MSYINKFLVLESEEVRGNIEEVKKFVEIAPMDIRYASTAVREDKELAKFVININQDAYEFLGNEIKKDKDIAFQAFQKSKHIIRFFPEELLQNKIFAFKLIEIDPFVIENLSEKLMKDEEIMKACISREPRLLKFNKSEDLEKDVSFWLSQVGASADNLFFIPLSLQMDSDFREKAIQQAKPESLELHLFKLEDERLVLDILEKRVDLFPVISNRFKTADFSLPFVKADITNVNHVSLDLLRDKLFVAKVFEIEPEFNKILSKDKIKDSQFKLVLKEVITDSKKAQKEKKMKP